MPRAGSIAVTLAAIAGRVIQLVFFYNIRVDASFQVMATQALANGHGISNAVVLPGQLSDVLYPPLINWPPGYSLLLYPFYILFNRNYIAAGITLDIVAAVLLILSARALLRLLGTSALFVNLFTLVCGFFIYYFYFIASSDAIAIAFFVTALYYALRLLKGQDHWLRHTLMLSVCLVLTGALKYLFIPVVFILPVFILVRGRLARDRPLLRAGAISGLILGSVLGAMLLYQKSVSGAATYISQPERGFFPGHLLDTYPALPNALVSTDTLALLVPQRWNHWIQRIYQVLYLTGGVGLAWLLFNNTRRKLRERSLIHDFLYLSFFISIAIVLLLAFLSIRVAKEEFVPGRFWTYIEEPRYHGMIVVLLHLSLFLIASRAFQTPLQKYRYLLVALPLLLLPELLRGLLFDANRLAKIRSEEYSWHVDERLQQYGARVLDSAVRAHPGVQASVTASRDYLASRVALCSDVPVMHDAIHLNNPATLSARKPALILLILYEQDLELYRPFLSRHHLPASGYFYGYYFYPVYVAPR